MYNAEDCSSHFGLRNVWLDLIAACGPHGPHGPHWGNRELILNKCCGVAEVLLGGAGQQTFKTHMHPAYQGTKDQHICNVVCEAVCWWLGGAARSHFRFCPSHNFLPLFISGTSPPSSSSSSSSSSSGCI